MIIQNNYKHKPIEQTMIWYTYEQEKYTKKAYTL